MPLDGSLLDWSAIASRYTRAILTGNGASLAVSDRFAYKSLFKEAALQLGDRAVFDALDTTNFELVLDALRVARVVCREAGHGSLSIYNQQRRVRRSLVDAVARVHVPWMSIADATLGKIRTGLRHYEYVFTTNYDLLDYWAIMSTNPAGFRDYFWGPANSFDSVDASVSANMTKILYLHGALHLFRDAAGRTCKRTAASANLLDSFASAQDVPLFVSEGRSKDKLLAIRRSDYLSFAYETFNRECNSLVIFGHSLGDQDAHLRRVIAQSAARVAISVRPGTRSSVKQRKAEITALLPTTHLEFFDAESHPLGDIDLAV